MHLIFTLIRNGKTKTWHTGSGGSTETDTEKDNSTDFKTLNVSSIGFGLDYYKNEKNALFVHPNFQYGFLGIAKNESLNRNMYSVGISTGIRL